jgi:hypothetical protein
MKRFRKAALGVGIPLSVALHYMNYNFCRIHKTLKVTPAMAAGVTDKLWEISDVVAMLEKWEAVR